MTKIKTLKNRKSGESVAPRTHVKAVFDDNGNTLDSLLGVQDEKLSELGSYVENPEYDRAYTDAEGRFLWGIKQDGSIEWAKGVPTPVKKYVELLDLENDEEIERINQLVIGLLADVKVLTDTYHYISNPEWACAIVDSEGRILMGVKKNGGYYVPNREMLEIYNDPEGRTEITLDADNRIISYRDEDGVKHENKQHTKEASFDSIILSEKNGKEIAESLKKVNFTTDIPSDFSNSNFIELPIPRIAARVKLIVNKMPTSKTDNIKGYLEYNDKDGNYFKKQIVLNSQGSSSMAYIRPDGSRGNLGIDFTDCEIKFGNWVSQDSFHIKKYYIDAFRGQCVVAYKLMEQVYQTRPLGEKKPFDYIKRNNSLYDGVGSLDKDYNTGAMCHPDGFPIVIYVNTGGEDVFYGVYAWCLKKHRDNYYSKKTAANNIILDGELYDSNLWGGSIDWKKFEIRNPKDLIDIDGNKYDGENPKELSNTDALSSETKSYIERLSSAKSALDMNKTRETFEEYFLVDPFIDWYLISQVIYNIDGFGKNWIWCTWDGQLWTPTLYDADSIFGSSPIGTFVISNSTTSVIRQSMAAYLADLYDDDIKSRYSDLRKKGVFDVDNIVGLLTKWLDSIGYKNLKDDLDLLNETPSYRDSYINENWQLVNYTWNLNNDTYNSAKVYSEGETCVYYGYLFKALNSVNGRPPLDEVYPNPPYGAGMHNSPLRVKNWLLDRIAYLDGVYNYIV